MAADKSNKYIYISSSFIMSTKIHVYEMRIAFTGMIFGLFVEGNNISSEKVDRYIIFSYVQ
jgi:hypothetical protein